MANTYGGGSATDETLPGPPQDLREATRFRAKFLKIRWNEPGENSEAVAEYEAQIRRAKPWTSKWENLPVNQDRRSAKATGLKTGTKYKFRV